jgi:membrane protein YqaA with SNARE-associated domain
MGSLAAAGLFFSAFLAATILPFSSEAALVAAFELGMGADEVLLYASLGNCLAVALNFFFGRLLYGAMKEKIKASKSGRRALLLAHRYGYYSLLLSPLPLVGDPITIAAGLIRLNFFWFALITFSLRIFRYWLILYWLQ